MEQFWKKKDFKKQISHDAHTQLFRKSSHNVKIDLNSFSPEEQMYLQSSTVLT